MSLLGPFSVAFPIVFSTGGDTTSKAFDQHIKEIKRIYGILTALDNEIRAADDFDSAVGNIDDKLETHIKSADPHPNWKPNLKFSDLTGDIPAASVKGELTQATIDGSKVLNKLTQATIDASRVTNLEQKIKDVAGGLSSGEDNNSGYGITEGTLAENGYVKFGNGLMIQWGKVLYAKDAVNITFPYSFSNDCYTVAMIPIVGTGGSDTNYTPAALLRLRGISKTGFSFSSTSLTSSEGTSSGSGPTIIPNPDVTTTSQYAMRYLAIGK